MSIQNRYLVPSVGTANSNVGILGGNTVALIAGSVCNKTANIISVNLWVSPTVGSNTSYLSNVTINPNTTLTVFGFNQKQFLLNGDSLWANCNVNSGFDLIISTAEGI